MDPCRAIDGFIGGTEDLAVDYLAGQVFVSADDKRRVRDGAIYVLGFDALARDAIPRKVSPDLPDFHPHGIGLWVGDRGERRLFVVNHPRGGQSRVDIFDVDRDGTLRLTSDGGAWRELSRPNDVAPYGPTSFYATNDHGGPGRTTEGGGVFDGLEALFSLDLAAVVQVDARRHARVAARGLTFANGVALSTDRSRLYVSETVDGTVRLYRRSSAGGLTLDQRVQVGPGPDNLVVDAHDRVWVGAHNSLMAVALRRWSPERPSPGRALWIAPSGAVSSPVFETEGRDLSALSVAALIEGHLVLGSIDQPRLLVCSIGFGDDDLARSMVQGTDVLHPPL